MVISIPMIKLAQSCNIVMLLKLRLEYVSPNNLDHIGNFITPVVNEMMNNIAIIFTQYFNFIL